MKIKIWSNVHCAFAARHLCNQLGVLGHQADIIDHWDPSDDTLHILYQVAGKWNLPPNYIIQQTEPWNSHWMSQEYLTKTIPNAKAVWDYSADNFKAYNHPNKCIVTPGIRPQSHKMKDIPLLFYGHIDGSPRRREIVERLQRQHKMEVVTNTTGPAMWKILGRTNTVINVHYHEEAPLELYRFHEALSFGCQVWLEDEQRFYTHDQDNLEEIKHGLSLAGI
jgi:hypothetical protein